MREPDARTVPSAAEPAGGTDWRIDLAAGLISIGLGSWLFWQTFSFTVTASERVGGGIDAAGYPRLLAGLTVALGAILVARACWKRRARPAPDEAGARLRTAGALAILLLYTLALEPVGFLIATPPALVALLRLVGRRRLLPAAMAAIVFTAVIFLLFRYGVNIVLPEGLLRGLSP